MEDIDSLNFMEMAMLIEEFKVRVRVGVKTNRFLGQRALPGSPCM